MSEPKIYYFDYNATTPVAPEVLESMLPFFRDLWGNPSSAYHFGHQLTKPIEAAREKVAALIQAEPREVMFTSGGTESNNSALHSALATHTTKRHVLTTAVEHSAIIKFCDHLRRQHYDVTLLPVESDGSLDIHLLEKSIRPETAIVSVMWANNETGVIFPIAEIAAICRSKGVLFHTDAVQVPGKLAMDVKELGVDFLSLSAHKLHAPKGIGALYIKHHTRYAPYVVGGGQERGRRGGTENVPYLVGFGRAAELAAASSRREQTHVGALRDRMEQEILKQVPRATRNGSRDSRLPNTTNLAFDGVEAGEVLKALDQLGICASSGSACTTGSLAPSHVLTAMGLSEARARSSIRFSLGCDNTEADVNCLLDHLPAIISRLRAGKIFTGETTPVSKPSPGQS
jgi:cysteine desulfurase